MSDHSRPIPLPAPHKTHPDTDPKATSTTPTATPLAPVLHSVRQVYLKEANFMVTIRNTCVALLSSLGMFAAVGCAERHNSIPSSARLVAEDQGRSDFVAPSDGDVFVEDRSANKLLYSGKINEGERLRVDPMDDKLTINGQVVRDQRIRDLNNIRVFFRADPRADVAGSRQTVVVPVQPAQPARQSGDSEIIVQPRSEGDADTVRVRPGANNDAKVTVEPGDDGSKVTIERDRDR